jgi:DNA invertase Pin-like site-specific DNA recombinase
VHCIQTSASSTPIACSSESIGSDSIDTWLTDKKPAMFVLFTTVHTLAVWNQSSLTLLIMLRLVREMNGRGVSVEFVKENMSFTVGNDDPRSTLMFTMLSAFAQFERSLIKERQREGIALAKAKGNVYKGRKPALNAKQIAQLCEQAATGVNKTKLAKEFGISRETLYQYIRCQ